MAVRCVNPMGVAVRPERSTSHGHFPLEYFDSEASKDKEPLKRSECALFYGEILGSPRSRSVGVQ